MSSSDEENPDNMIYQRTPVKEITDYKVTDDGVEEEEEDNYPGYSNHMLEDIKEDQSLEVSDVSEERARTPK